MHEHLVDLLHTVVEAVNPDYERARWDGLLGPEIVTDEALIATVVLVADAHGLAELPALP